MIEGWTSSDEQRTAFLTHVEDAEYPEMNYLIMEPRFDDGTWVYEITEAFEHLQDAENYLTVNGYPYVGPSLPF